MHTQTLAVVTLVLALGAAFTAAAQGSDVIEDGRLAAALQIAGQDGRVRGMPLVEESLKVEIDGQHATTRLRQVFHNPEPQVVEGSYDLVAGQGARVSGFAYWNGEAKIVGEVFERELAERVYARVTSRRRDPGLLVQRGEGSFGFRVFPIQPGEDKRIEIAYTQWLPRRGRRIEYRAPVNDARASIELLIKSAHALENLRSDTHALRVEQVRGGLRVRARADGNPRALVLLYDVVDKPFEPALAVHSDSGQDGYFVLSLAAPAGGESAAIAKDVTLVLDRSGSMAGAPLEHARRAAAGIIERLDARDRVNVIVFDDDVDPLFDRPLAVSEDTRGDAIAFVSNISSGGGTNLAFALSTALAHQHDGAERPRVVLFITDGRSDSARALAVVQRDQRDVRVFTVGVGPEVDRALLARLAAEKRGRFTFIASESEIESALHDVYSQIAEPVLVDVTISADGAVLRRVYPRTLPDLFARDELRISGRLRGEGSVRFTIEGTQNGRRVRREVTADLGARTPRPWVGKLWAEARVDDLLEEIALDGGRTELREEVVDLSLAYNFVTPFTAFLAIPESEIGADVAGDIEHGRARKADVLERLDDARALRGAAPQSGFAGPDDLLDGALQGMSAAMPPPAPSREMMIEEADAEPQVQASDGEGTSFKPRTERAERAGCASCAIGGRRAPGAAAWLAVLLLAAVLVRRERTRSSVAANEHLDKRTPKAP